MANNYVTATEVKNYKVAGVAALPSGLYTDGEIDAKVALIESMVENITGDIFYARTETNRFDGNGKNVLFFHTQGVPYQLLSVTSCQDIDIDGSVQETFVLNDDFVVYPYYIETVKGWPEDRPRRGVFRGGHWPLGQKNIVVVGSWGKSAIPPEVKESVILLTLEALYPGSTRMQRDGIASVSWPDFSLSFKGEGKLGTSTGFLETDRYLQRHINYIGLFEQPEVDTPPGDTLIIRD